MEKNKIIDRIKKAAQRDAELRKDVRYRRAMAFFIKKGFLRANDDFSRDYYARLRVQDALWAGQNVEPRILEVLPAAMARLPRSFLDDAKKIKDHRQVVQDLIEGKEAGHDFLGVPYNRIRVWMDLPLRDGRTKPAQEKKITRTFRLNPKVVEKLRQLKQLTGKSETELIEKLVAGAGRDLSYLRRS